jgi:hypothetical protein
MEHALDPEAAATTAWAMARFAELDRLHHAEERGISRFTLPRYDLEVRFAGRCVAQILCQAFEHRNTTRANGAIGAPTPVAPGGTLTWQIADTSTETLPADHGPPPTVNPFGTIRHDATNSVLIERRRGMISVFDAATATVTTLVDGVDAIDTDVAAKPLHRFLMPLLLQRGVVLCHAALVGGTHQGMLVTGMGGVGKSTISAAAVDAGAGFCSDDFVAIEQSDAGLVGHCLYASLMLDERQIGRFPRLLQHARHYRRDVFAKMMLPLCGTFEPSLRTSLMIDAIAVPQIVPDPTSALVKGRRAEVFKALIPTSVFSSPWRETERAKMLFELVAPLAPMTYRSGADFSGIAAPLISRYG